MPKYLPWKIIAILLGGALPLLAASLLLDINPAPPLVGYIVGLLACLSADRRWALATPVVSVAAYLAVVLLPLPTGVSIYVVALVLVGLMVAGRHFGAANAFGQAAFGWVFLAFVPSIDLDAAALVAHVAGGAVGASVAIYLGMESFRRSAAVTTTASDLVTFVTLALGFLLSIAAARVLGLGHGYWIPFVFLQVAMAADTHHPAIAMQRIAGATVGIYLASLAGDVIGFTSLRLVATLACVVVGLRLLAAWPITSRALLTGAVILLLTRPGDKDAAETRLLAELLGLLAVLLSSGLYVCLNYIGEHRK